MKRNAQKSIQEAPMSDTRHLSTVNLDERRHSQGPSTEAALSRPQGPHTEMVMLAKADAWMHQFKTRLNISIIALVVVWGAVSYFKSTGLQMAARSVAEPERILADGSTEASEVPEVEVDSLNREVPEEPVQAVATEKVSARPELKTAVPFQKSVAPALKSAAASHAKKAAPSKAGKNTRKLKKSVASKPVLR